MLCCYYWSKDCSMSVANAKQRLSNCLSNFDTLLNNEIVTVDDEDNIHIEFLDEQFDKVSSISRKRSKSGRLGGTASAKQVLNKPKASAKQLPIYKDNDNDKDNDIEKRALKFKMSIAPFVKIYSKEMLIAFYDYWTEPNKSGTRMRFELEKTWSLKNRLERWSRNEKPRDKNSYTPDVKPTAQERIDRYYSNYEELLRSGLSHEEAMASVKNHEYTNADEVLLLAKIKGGKA